MINHPLMRPVSSFLLCVGLLASTTMAQRVFVIDGLNRAGAHFTDLPAAEAAASDGDVFYLRPDGGVYSAITTSKALTILANQASIQVTRTQPFRVTGLAAGRDFVLQRCNMFINQVPPAAMVELEQCAGRVHLQQATLANFSGGAAVAAIGCVGVTIRDSRLNGLPAVLARNSTVTVSGCQLVGTSASDAVALPAGEGVRLEDATAWFGATHIVGGNGASVPPAPAMTMAGSTATVGGKSIARLRAGFYGTAGGSAAVPGVRGQASIVRIDPAIVVEPRGGAQPFVGVVVDATVPPSLLMTGVSIVRVAFEGIPTAVNATLVGAAAGPAYGGQFAGSLWLAPGSLVAIPGVLPGFQTLALPTGATVGVQIASLAGLAVELSNPGFVTVP